MSKEYFYRTDEFPTLTVLVSAPATLAGQTWRGVLPLSSLSLDSRQSPGAIISAVLAAQFGGASIPENVSCCLFANAHGADWNGDFDPRQTPLGSIGFELAFSSDFAGIVDVPLVFTVLCKASDAPAMADIELPTIAVNTTDITLKDIENGVVSCGFYLETAAAAVPSPVTLTGSFEVTGLMHNEEAEALVTHDAFDLCEYPTVDAPDGVRVTVLGHGDSGDSTTASQFVLLIQNNGLTTYDADGTFTLGWSRRGYA